MNNRNNESNKESGNDIMSCNRAVPQTAEDVQRRSLVTGGFEPLEKPVHDEQCSEGYELVGYRRGLKVFRLNSS